MPHPGLPADETSETAAQVPARTRATRRPSAARPRVLAVACTVLGLTACPDLPTLPSGPGDTVADVDGGDADVFVPLALSRVVASIGEPDGGERVSVLGSGIQPGALVRFGDEPGSGVLVLDAGQLNVNVPPGTPGTLVDVEVELPDGQTEVLLDAYLYRGPMELASIEPTIGPSAGGVAVTLTGEFFPEEARVFLGGRELVDAEIVDAETITGVLPSRVSGQEGLVDVVVTDGFEQRVLPQAFRFVDALDVAWVSPGVGPSQGGTFVTLYGSGLAPETVVSVGGRVAEIVTPGDGASLTLRTPPGGHGAADLYLETPVAAETLVRAFYYEDPSQLTSEPAVHNAWPTAGPASGGQQAALTVTGFDGADVLQGLRVEFDGAEAAIVEARALERQIVVATPPGTPGPASVRIVWPDGGSALGTGLYTYRPSLRVDAVDPATGGVAGGTTVTVEGEGFTDDLELLFGGVPGTDVTLLKEGGATVRTPPGVPGAVDVLARQGGLEARAVGAFAYEAAGPPELLAVTPGRGSQSGGRLVRLHGQGLAGTSPLVRFGTEEAWSVEVVDDATVHARAPRGEVGHVNVSAALGGDPDDDPLIAMPYEYFDPTLQYGGTVGGAIPEALNVTVLDQVTREPIDQAFVILWDDLDTPYQGLTDDRGQLTLSDPLFGPPQMVTAGKDNYTTASVVDFDARDVTLFLINLQPSSGGGGGGGGPGPQTLPPSQLAGAVGGMDKQIFPPPGDCANKDIASLPGSLCQPCDTDEDCPLSGERCTDLGDLGQFCTVGCETDADCPSGFDCVGVGFGAVECVPAFGQRTAWCTTSIGSVFEDRPEAGFGASGFTNGASNYGFQTDPGEKAVVCFGGYVDHDTGDFTPQAMGVRRHVFAQPGQDVSGQDVTLDIPLSRTLRVRLDDPPLGPGEPNWHEVDVYLDLGSDGVFPMPVRGARDADDAVFELPWFPVAFEESLFDASYTFYAGAYLNKADDGEYDEATFTLHEDVIEIDDDAVFSVVDDVALRGRTGIRQDVHAMDGTGTGRVWAVGDDGQVLAWSGTAWALQKAPTEVTLRGVWAAPGVEDEAWAVGDDGTVVRWTGLVWQGVLTAGLGGSSLTAVAGVRAAPEPVEPAEPDEPDDDAGGQIAGPGAEPEPAVTVFVGGEAGLFRYDGPSAEPELVAFPAGGVADLEVAGDTLWAVSTTGAVLARPVDGGPWKTMADASGGYRAVDALGEDAVWAVGDDGRIGEWDGTVFFEYLPVTRRDLHAVHAAAPDRVWAVGDAGALIAWDGLSWRETDPVQHVDLRGVHALPPDEFGVEVTVAGGMHTVVLGPILHLPDPISPTPVTGELLGLELSWTDTGPQASAHYVQLLEASGFPFWTLMADGDQSRILLPDLTAAWGLQPLWPGPGSLQLVRIYSPSFTVDRYDRTMISQDRWQSWAISRFALSIPAAPF